MAGRGLSLDEYLTQYLREPTDALRYVLSVFDDDRLVDKTSDTCRALSKVQKADPFGLSGDKQKPGGKTCGKT